MRKSRLSYLDGLRGLAALAVVVFHFGRDFLPPSSMLNVETGAPITEAPLFGLMNGAFAVVIFFVLSGFVIGASADQASQPFPILALRRMIRLGIPVAATSMIAYALIVAFPNAAADLDLIHPLGSTPHMRGAPGFLAAVKMAVSDPWLWGHSRLNGALWTMQTELVGSLAIYGIFELPRKSRIAALGAMFAAAIATGHFWYIGFPIGGLFYLIDLPQRRAPPIGAILIAIGVLAGHNPSWDKSNALLMSAGGAVLVAGTMLCPAIKGLLDTRFPRWLGRISFGLYLTHEPLMLTIGATIYLTARPNALWLLAPVIGACLLLGWAATKFIDEPAIRFQKAIRMPAPKIEAATAE